MCLININSKLSRIKLFIHMLTEQYEGCISIIFSSYLRTFKFNSPKANYKARKSKEKIQSTQNIAQKSIYVIW